MSRQRFVGKLVLLGTLVWLTALAANAADDDSTSTSLVTVFMAGDSTMAAQPLLPATPARGWGQMLQPYFNDNVRVENYASGGQSSKSFLDKGRWQAILDRLKPGDFVIIQFGHNDGKPDEGRHTDPFGSFQQNLERFVREVRQRKATPILATSIIRNHYSEEDGTLIDTHGDYVVATRKVADEKSVPLLDLTTKTHELIVQLGPERSKQLFNNVERGDFAKYPDGFMDGTHLNTYGACRVCDLAIDEILTKVPELAKHVRQGPATVVGGEASRPTSQ